jgi:hypothetical protein
MEEEIIAGLILGFWIGAPVGWFLKAAFTWRRDAKRLSHTEAKPVPAPPQQPAPQVNSRLESLMERLNQRLETVEDRLEFTERLIDARSPGKAQAGRRLTAARRSQTAGHARD